MLRCERVPKQKQEQELVGVLQLVIFSFQKPRASNPVLAVARKRASMSSNVGVNIWLVRPSFIQPQASFTLGGLLDIHLFDCCKAHVLILKFHTLTGGRLCWTQRQSAGLPARHTQDTSPIAFVPADMPEHHSCLEQCALAQPLPRRRSSHARQCALIRCLLHHVRGLEVLFKRLAFAPTCRARAQQLYRTASQLRRHRAR